MRPSYHSISDCYFQSWIDAGIHHETSSGIEGSGGFIRNNYFFGSDTIAACIRLKCGYTFIHDNEILGCQAGILVQIENNPAGTIRIYENTIENQVYYGIGLFSIDNTTGMVDIHDNEFSVIGSSTYLGSVYVDDNAGVNWITYVSIHDNVTHHLLYNSSSKHIWVGAGSSVDIHNNSINEIGNASPAGIQISGSSSNDAISAPFSVTDNKFYGTFSFKHSLNPAGNIRIAYMDGCTYSELSSWGTPAAGSQVYVSDGTPGIPITASGTGCIAFYLDGQWQTPAVGPTGSTGPSGCPTGPTGTQSTVTGPTGNTGNASNITITSVSIDATFYPTFVSATTGNLSVNVQPTLTFNPGTTVFSLTGNLVVSNSSRIGNLSITNTTASTSTTTGAATIAGGIGVAGATFIGGTLSSGAYTLNNSGGSVSTIYADQIFTNSAGYSSETTHAMSWTGAGGTLVGRFGISFDGSQYTRFVWRDIYNSGVGSVELMSLDGSRRLVVQNSSRIGNLSITNTTATTSSTTGAVIVAGGIGASGNIYSSNSITGWSVTSTNGLFINSANITTNCVVSAGYNAMSVGPVTVNSGVTVTVASGQRWIVL